jgi:hypothetical protein
LSSGSASGGTVAKFKSEIFQSDISIIALVSFKGSRSINPWENDLVKTGAISEHVLSYLSRAAGRRSGGHVLRVSDRFQNTQPLVSEGQSSWQVLFTLNARQVCRDQRCSD